MEDKIDNVLDDGIAYVQLLATMGDQYTPAEDARTSTGKGRLGPEKDAKLQERLTLDGHTSPFEGVIAKVEMVAPLFVLRELDRHRTITKTADWELDIETPEESGRKWFARNEMSGRYVTLPDLYYHPQVIRGQSATNKQGGGQDMVGLHPEVVKEFQERGRSLTVMARALYDWAASQGIEKGLARIYNTQNQYTRIRFTGSLKNWCDFLYLRLPNVVLWECRQFAYAIEQVLLAQFPSPMKQWRENVYEAVKLTKAEAEALRLFLEHKQGNDELLKSVADKLRTKKG